MQLMQSSRALAQNGSVEWKALGSQELNALVAQALATNPELLGAQHQVIQAQTREQQPVPECCPRLLHLFVAVEQSQGNRTDSQNSSHCLWLGPYRLDVWESKAPWQRRQSCKCSAHCTTRKTCKVASRGLG